jgi:hypothetical protein
MAKTTIWIAALVLAAAPRGAFAQLSGNDYRNDRGVAAGTQPEPGLYLAGWYFHYTTDTLKDASGTQVVVSASSSLNGFAPAVTWVTPLKVLGAHIGMFALLPAQTQDFDLAQHLVDRSTGFGLGDLYVQPLVLGWHAPRADAIAAFGVYAPTGRFSPAALNNTGLGMTTLEWSAGTTVYLDEERHWNAATVAYWETHGEKRDTTTTVGRLLTLKGGLGFSPARDSTVIGGAYYAQWKVTADTFDAPVLDAVASASKSRIFAAGPDITVPIVAGGGLLTIVNVRAEWEFGVHNATQGVNVLITATFPIGQEHK